MADFFVWDCRSNNILGPYCETDARTLTEDLNLLDLENSIPIFASMVSKGKIKGPFYVKTEAERDRLRKLHMTKGIAA